MKEYQSLSHTRWDCKYHVVFIPKRRKKRVFGVLRCHLGEMFHELASHKESKIVEGHLMGDHVHICISIPPKYAVSNVVGYLKGKSAIQIVRKFGGRQKNFTGEAPSDQHGHGTHCAGTIFGREVQGRRIGVAPGVGRALIGKVLGEGGGGSDQLARAMLWACERSI